MNQKYEILKDQSIEVNGQTLYRIRALRDITALVSVKAGDIGGYVSNKDNLSQFDNCWVYNDAKMFDQSRLYHNARILDNVEMYDHGRMIGNSIASGNAKLFKHSRMDDSAVIIGDTELHGEVVLRGNAYIRGGYLTEQHHYMVLTNIGSENGTLTVFKTKEGISVNRGCFRGTVEQFLMEVQKKHGDNQFAVEYRTIIDLAVKRISG